MSSAAEARRTKKALALPDWQKAAKMIDFVQAYQEIRLADQPKEERM
jgi:hypothetical protein